MSNLDNFFDIEKSKLLDDYKMGKKEYKSFEFYDNDDSVMV